VPATRRRSLSNATLATVAEADASSTYRTSSCVNVRPLVSAREMTRRHRRCVAASEPDTH
jgi:hypothetical protein